VIARGGPAPRPGGGPTPPGGGPPAPPGGRPPPGSGDAFKEARRLALAGVALFPVAVVGFHLRFDFGVVQAIYLALLLELVPALSVAQLPVIGAMPIDRMTAYVHSSYLLAFLGSTALVLGWLDPGLQVMGLAAPDPASLALWCGALVVATGALQGLSWAATRWTPLEEMPLVRELLPRDGLETGAFVAVSLIAGLCEELAFRGYAVPVLTDALGGPWPAVAFTSVLFGALHAYQGPLGIARTALLGGAFGASFVLSGSLWPAIVVHAAIDVAMGLGVGELLLGPDEASSESHPPAEEG